MSKIHMCVCVCIHIYQQLSGPETHSHCRSTECCCMVFSDTLHLCQIENGAIPCILLAKTNKQTKPTKQSKISPIILTFMDNPLHINIQVTIQYAGSMRISHYSFVYLWIVNSLRIFFKTWIYICVYILFFNGITEQVCKNGINISSCPAICLK